MGATSSKLSLLNCSRMRFLLSGLFNRLRACRCRSFLRTASAFPVIVFSSLHFCVLPEYFLRSPAPGAKVKDMNRAGWNYQVFLPPFRSISPEFSMCSWHFSAIFLRTEGCFLTVQNQIGSWGGPYPTVVFPDHKKTKQKEKKICGYPFPPSGVPAEFDSDSPFAGVAGAGTQSEGGVV